MNITMIANINLDGIAWCLRRHVQLIAGFCFVPVPFGFVLGTMAASKEVAHNGTLRRCVKLAQQRAHFLHAMVGVRVLLHQEGRDCALGCKGSPFSLCVHLNMIITIFCFHALLRWLGEEKDVFLVVGTWSPFSTETTEAMVPSAGEVS